MHGVERGRLTAGRGGDQRATHLRQPAGGERCDRGDLQAVLAEGLAQPQEDDGRFLLGLEAREQDRGRGLEIRVGHRHRPARHRGGQELRLLVGVRAAAEVDVVGAQHDPGELGVRVGILERRPATDQHTGAAVGSGEPADGDRHGFRPRRNALAAVGLANQRCGDPVTLAWRR